MLFGGVLLTLAGVIVSGFVSGAHAGMAGGASAGGWQLSHLVAWPSAALLPALAQATMITCYDYWGYYNICFLGSEVKRPEKTIPRAILISIAVVAALYVAMNLAVLPSLDVVSTAAAKEGMQARLALVAEIAQSAFGRVAGQVLAALICGALSHRYFPCCWAIAACRTRRRDGNYFSGLAALHPRHGFPHRSLIALGLVATCFCFFSLGEVITLLVVIRILLQFLLQQAGVIWLRWKQPELARPFRMPLFPLPPLLAMAGFIFVLAYRPHPLQELGVAAGIAAFWNGDLYDSGAAAAGSGRFRPALMSALLSAYFQVCREVVRSSLAPPRGQSSLPALVPSSHARP